MVQSTITGDCFIRKYLSNVIIVDINSSEILRKTFPVIQLSFMRTNSHLLRSLINHIQKLCLFKVTKLNLNTRRLLKL